MWCSNCPRFGKAPINFRHVPISLWTLSFSVTQSSNPKNECSFYSIICVIHRRFLTDWILSGYLKGIAIIIPLQNATNSVTSLLEIFLIIYASRVTTISVSLGLMDFLSEFVTPCVSNPFILKWKLPLMSHLSKFCCIYLK